ncbi:nuclear RNA export factor 1-like [Schistocerca cancellata]|uniref:nuclear RNA export factor 1-like n=1 Tax=Schistocerca cancellata TaxID=274614 RepID=UPI002118994F|nr:nuclear RNA export factor 1-like [Schistocerca cancellata]
MDWRPNQRVLTQVPVTKDPIIERGPVLYGGRGKPQYQRQPLPAVQPHRPLPAVQPRQLLPAVQPPPVVQPHHPPPVVQPPVVQQPVVQQSHYQPPPVVQPPVVQQPVVQPSHYQASPVVKPPVVQQSFYQSLTHSTVSSQAVQQAVGTFAQTGIAEEFVELNSSNSLKFANMHGDILTDIGRNASQWHQITIKTPVPEYERRFVVAAINKRISPQKITPYFFRMENLRITFFVNMCGLALRTLCRRDLKVPYVSDKFDEIEMTVKLFSKHFNLSEALKEIISRRLDSPKKFLDLSYINSIPEVQEMLFDPTDNWHILDQMLRVAEVSAPGLVALRLAGNGITTLTLLWDFLVHSKWKSLRTLDVSDNEVKSTGTVSLSRALQISEVYLDCNPICHMLKRDSYISAIKATFPRLAKLDGTYLHTTAHLPYWKPNFIVNGTGDPGEFADQFIEHFFTLYDDPDRMKLRGLYHEKAYFSLCSLYLDAQFTTPNARLSAYIDETRNLLRCSDMKKANAALTHGSEEILERLSSLPTTQHDPYTFAVDLLVHTPKMTVLTVTGVFRDIAKQKSSHRHFSRTFVLQRRENDEYQITNDILYISNAATREAEEAFKYVRPPKKIKKKRPTPNLSECEKESMTGMVQQLTSMSALWSRKCLEDTDWDMKEALQIFVELYEMSKIPKSAFITSK